MVFYCVFADEQLVCNLLVGHMPAHQAQHLHLTVGQRRLALRHRNGLRLREIASARHNLLCYLQKKTQTFTLVNKSVRSCRLCTRHIGNLIKSRHHNNFNLRIFFADILCRLESGCAALRANIHQHQIGMKPFAVQLGIVRARHLSCDLKAVFRRKNRSERLPHGHMILYN